jgi:hypothetical protein
MKQLPILIDFWVWQFLLIDFKRKWTIARGSLLKSKSGIHLSGTAGDSFFNFNSN